MIIVTSLLLGWNTWGKALYRRNGLFWLQSITARKSLQEHSEALHITSTVMKQKVMISRAQHSLSINTVQDPSLENDAAHGEHICVLQLTRSKIMPICKSVSQVMLNLIKSAIDIHQHSNAQFTRPADREMSETAKG